MKTRMFLFLAAATLLLAAGCRSIPLPEGVIPAEKMTQTPARPEPVEPLRRLAASGDPDGTFRYGLQLLFAENSRQPVEKPEFPNGVPFGIRPENWSPADLWIARAAQLGSPEAKYYTAAARQAVLERRQMLKLVKEAAEAGVAPALNRLGTYYYFGMGVEVDNAEAVRLFAAAARQGHPVALHNLAVCLMNGSGIAADEAAAVRLLRMAAFRGTEQSRRNLEWCYRTGLGVEVDRSKAFYWKDINRIPPAGTEEQFPADKVEELDLQVELP